MQGMVKFHYDCMAASTRAGVSTRQVHNSRLTERLSLSLSLSLSLRVRFRGLSRDSVAIRIF